MSEHDCLTFLNADNSVPSEFTKAGRAVYNAKHGKKEGNVVFTVALVKQKDILDEMQNLIIKTQMKSRSESIKPFIFDGKQDFSIKDNISISELIPNEKFVDIYIGAPFYFSLNHVYYRLRKQDESNLLIIGDDPEAALSITKHSLSQISHQSHPDTQYYIFDMFPVDSDLQGKFSDLSDEGLKTLNIIYESRKIDECLTTILNTLEQQCDNKSKIGKVILCILNFHTIRDFKKGEFGTPSELSIKLLRIIREGPANSIHTILHVLNRKSFEDRLDWASMDEFENKILLNSQNPRDYGSSIDDDSIEKSYAYIIHPKSRYEADKFKVYHL
jgi:hypothetical protein